MNPAARKPSVVVSLGTDHHKFDRLVDWIDLWIEQRQGEVDCLIQHGFSRAPLHALAVERMPRQALLELYLEADVVVVQGGPGSILDARGAGRIPLAVPRRAELDEVVDGHQKVFTEAMVAQGDAIMVESYEELVAQLERAIAEPSLVASLPRVARPDEAADKLEAAITAGWNQAAKGRTLHRIRQLWLATGPATDDTQKRMNDNPGKVRAATESRAT